MKQVGRGVAYGAVTIVNAISCGLGAALGVDLKTEAYAEITNSPGRFECHILSDLNENTELVEEVCRSLLRHFDLHDEYGAIVETKSNIPIARGLKSSSAAANATSLAVLAAIDRDIDDLTLINLGVNAAIRAGVTITGAFDDACASYYGDIVITNNFERKILKRFLVGDDYSVMIHVPAKKAYTANSRIEKMRLISREIEALHRLAAEGYYWSSMTLNGLAYSSVIGYETRVAIDAIEAGAVAAGLSGKGPSVAAVTSPSNKDRIRNAWKEYEGEVIETKINHEKAHRIQ